MKFIRNYKSTLILILSLIISFFIGIIFKDKTSILKPFGDLFINLLLVIIIPMIFITITSSIGKMNNPKKIGKILISILGTFIIVSLISVIVGILFTKNVTLVSSNNFNNIISDIDTSINDNGENINFLQRTVSTISVSGFDKLLTNDNLIAVIVFSILVGISINISKEKGKKFLEVLDSANNVIQKYIKIVMYYAPIGLGCYFANLIGTYGSSIAKGYGKTFIIYLLVSLFMYFIIYSIYAFLAGGKRGFKTYWKHILPPTFCALATCSSAASIPVNIKATKEMGISDDIADTIVPLGTSFHKDGSIIGSVFKIMFLINLFNINTSTGKIIYIALIATLLVSAVPIGGGTISETLIITMLGFPLSTLPILTIIATIIDAPATVLNVVGDTASSMIVNKIVNKKTD